MDRLFLGRYSRLIFLGDSSSDNGNVLRMTCGTSPLPDSVYWQGRYSNGKTWADRLEDMSGTTAINLAYGCATIDNNLAAGTVLMPSGVREEVPSAMDQVDKLDALVAELKPSELVFLQIGANDLESFIDTSFVHRKCEFTTHLLAERLVKLVERLCKDLGARNVVVMNVRSREDYPSVLAHKDPQKVEMTRKITASLNAEIRSGIATLQAALGSTYHIMVFDTYAFQKKIIQDPVAYGTDPDTRTPSYTGIPTDGSPVVLNNPDTKLFLDGAHMTARVHALLAADVLKALALAAMDIRNNNK
ncbi:hypothetical protein COEREDRAFT_90524 [Coemansia reversa NRRL 1564]|uniref:SGNH hydrolase n=1 Tax=Coemansia reversa (strain ATCC 12441 / NRRL 1564) TaxID=763665 RepID=A0A2G5BJI7_COERN|nr:hypothetical protein COEREDRAFT_90524 [Coemansia reversa NRRL 1564]|eukprot:PIA19180.1 hypothetical protein COEREDRAFT_90524 [Coemansia reversa NRRL 1564]